jgi:hypothetical protein
MNKYKCILTIIAAVLTGCETPYQDLKSDGGFRTQRTGPDQVSVTFHGNAYTSGRRVVEFAMLRAADLGIRRSYNYLTVDHQGNLSTSTTGFVTMPGHTSGSAYRFGGVTNFNFTTTPPTTISYPIVFPAFQLVVTFHHTKPETWKTVYDLRKAREHICLKYHLKPNNLVTEKADALVAAAKAN